MGEGKRGGDANFGKYLFFLKLAQLGRCALKIETRFVRDAGHCRGAIAVAECMDRCVRSVLQTRACADVQSNDILVEPGFCPPSTAHRNKGSTGKLVGPTKKGTTGLGAMFLGPRSNSRRGLRQPAFLHARTSVGFLLDTLSSHFACFSCRPRLTRSAVVDPAD